MGRYTINCIVLQIFSAQKGADGSRYCSAFLSLDTGVKSEDGEEVLKKYEGQFFVSPLGVAYCVLINNEWKEMSLVPFSPLLRLSLQAQPDI